MNLAHAERLAMVETLRETGPDAPTLCDGWSTRDLVAHLVVRERRPDTGPGVLIERFAGHTEKVRRAAAVGESWERLLAKLESGPPVYSPFWPIDRWANLAEMFVHHEDVLRGAADADAAWSPRELSPALSTALRRPATMMGKMAIKEAPAQVSLITTSGEVLAVGGVGDTPVTITGTVGELTLFAFGRNPVDLRFSGPQREIDAVVGMKRGM